MTTIHRSPARRSNLALRSATCLLTTAVATLAGAHVASAQGLPEAASAEHPAPPPVALTPVAVDAASPSSEAHGEVLERGAREVVVSGTGWRRGDRVEFSVLRPGAGDDLERGSDVVGVGEVTGVGTGRARVRLGIDVRVPQGAVAQRAPEAGASSYPLAPPRLANVLHVGVEARAFLPVGAPVGLGILGGLHAMYRFRAPIALRAQIGPSGFVTSRPGGGTLSGLGFLSLDTQYFEVGLGAGAMTAVEYADRFDPITNRVVSSRNAYVAFSLGQLVRIGSVDGLMLLAQTDVYVRDDRFAFGNLNATLQVPINDRWWIQVRGGGGAAGYGYGEAAVRHLLQGNGDAGSLFVSGVVGGAGVATQEGFYGGPSVGANLEWRL